MFLLSVEMWIYLFLGDNAFVREILYRFNNYFTQFLARSAENKLISKNVAQFERSFEKIVLEHSNIILGDRNRIVNLGLQFSIQSSY